MAGHVAQLKDRDGRPLKRKDGTSIWRARYPDPAGRKATDQIERRFRSKQDAENWIKRQGVSVLDGVHVDPRNGERSLGAVADEWRETWGDLAENTRLGYHYTLNKHIVGTAASPARFYRAKVGAMSTEVIQRWVNDLSKDHAPAAVRRIYTVMRSVMRVAVERRYISVNPCDSVKLPKKTARSGGRRMVMLTPAEVRTLASAMPEEYRMPVLIAAWCGLRAGELWALRRRDVDPLHGVIRVERGLKEINTSAAGLVPGLVLGPPKTEESNRRVSVPPPLLRLLTAYIEQPSRLSPGGVLTIRDDGDGFEWGVSADRLDPDALLFTTARGYPVRHNLFYKRVFKVVIEGAPAIKGEPAKRGRPAAATVDRPAVPAALPERLHALRFHDLRHTCASLSLAVAPNLHVVKERLGHKDIRMTINTYGHLVPSVDRALADGLGALFAAEETPEVVELRRADDA